MPLHFYQTTAMLTYASQILPATNLWHPFRLYICMR